MDQLEERVQQGIGNQFADTFEDLDYNLIHSQNYCRKEMDQLEKRVQQGIGNNLYSQLGVNQHDIFLFEL